MLVFVLGLLFYLSAKATLCYCPGSYVLPGVLSIISAIFGSRWIRIASICLFLLSIVGGIQDYQAEKHIEAIFRAVDEKQRAMTNSVAK